MKKNAFLPRGLLTAFLLLYAFFALVPAAIYRVGQIERNENKKTESTVGKKNEASSSHTESTASIPGFLEGQQLAIATNETEFTLYDTATGEDIHVPERDFIKAAVACEMDLSAPEEALKAQALASYTYYCRQRQDGQQIACDTENWLVYVPQESMEARWGEDFAQYNALLDKVVDAVSGQVITWQGAPILAAYFAISPGATESAENVWSPDANIEHPYLQAVASPGDMLSDGYRSTVEFTTEEFLEKITAHGLQEPEGAPETWLTNVEYSPSGMVKTAQLGEETVTGTELREMFGLRSASFHCQAEESGFRFEVLGWGHGVGMSQVGAAFLAKQGADYQEILEHYYPGTQITER